ncbi:hypothetical protein AD929_03480 [Gluconobacter potus]|uniref:Uncharacterized protein n=2 Tax=Gluconobacter potus TaxID=2724927 RepID=A0A149QXY1_9PROT|nr:hypothetical protein AD929_03480 [Gluconobacter potus]
MSDLIMQAALSRRRLEAEQDITRQWMERSQNQEKAILELQKEVLFQKMIVAAVVAQRDFLRESPDHIEMSRNLTDEFKKDGTQKTFFRRLFERAFDKKGRELGVVNPETWRD